MKLSPKALILDLLAAAGVESLSVRHLLRAGDLFGHSSNAMRVTLARMKARGLVEAPSRGEYCLGPGAEALGKEAAAWRDRQRWPGPWDGRWSMVHASGASLGAPARALRLLGFRALDTGLYLRPNNLGSARALRQRLTRLGLPATAHIFVADELGARNEAHARSLWDGSAIDGACRSALDQLEQSAQRLSRLSVEAAARESFLTGGAAIRVLLYDPLLPSPLAEDSLRNQLFESMSGYDRLGRGCWARLVEHVCEVVS